MLEDAFRLVWTELESSVTTAFAVLIGVTILENEMMRIPAGVVRTEVTDLSGIVLALLAVVFFLSRTHFITRQRIP